MDEKLSQNNPFPPVFLRIGLLLILLASSTSVIISTTWIYHRVHHSLGLEIADVAVAFLVIVILGLVLVGFGAGLGAKRVLRTRKAKALKIYHSFKWCKTFQFLWTYIGPLPESQKKVSPHKQDVPEIAALPARPPKRGRIPTYPMDRWIKVVSAWENRDTWRNPITLEEFLSQEFGTCADGSPKISKKTYYDWQKKVHEEVRKQQTMKKDISS
jgi:hypothetical protein